MARRWQVACASPVHGHWWMDECKRVSSSLFCRRLYVCFFILLLGHIYTDSDTLDAAIDMLPKTLLRHVM